MSIDDVKTNLIEPHFEQEAQYLIAENQQILNEDSYKPQVGVNVIILSYNRPRMLLEAIYSVLYQDYDNLKIWIADDGSDFDISQAIHDEFDGPIIHKIKLRQTPHISPEERAKASRLANNINSIVASIPAHEIVHYLCDDDLMGENWLTRSSIALELNRNQHMAQGQAFTFKDGQEIKDAVFGMPGDNPNLPWAYYGTGTFCHLAYCWHLEGVKWHDNAYGHSQDIDFIDSMLKAHQQSLIIDSPSIYRREHAKSLSSLLGRKDENGKYVPDFIPPPANPEILQGMME